MRETKQKKLSQDYSQRYSNTEAKSKFQQASNAISEEIKKEQTG